MWRSQVLKFEHICASWIWPGEQIQDVYLETCCTCNLIFACLGKPVSAKSPSTTMSVASLIGLEIKHLVNIWYDQFWSCFYGGDIITFTSCYETVHIPFLSGFWNSLATRRRGGLGGRGAKPPFPQGRTDGVWGGEAPPKINDNTNIQLYSTPSLYNLPLSLYIYHYCYYY